MEMQVNTDDSLGGGPEIDDFRQQTDTLLRSLEDNDFEAAMSMIKEINEVHDRSFFSILGKLTRGLHDAVSELNVPSSKGEASNDATQVNLDNVIRVTDEAANRTLDMTDQGMASAKALSSRAEALGPKVQQLLLSGKLDSEDAKITADLASFVQDTQFSSDAILSNFKAILMAQNFQDLTSQSIAKTINIIRGVEGSLVTLTQYASLLEQLSNYGDPASGKAELEDGTEELMSSIDMLGAAAAPEHLDQGDVDDLLSSLGF